MVGIIKKIDSLVRNRTTYRVGLLQAKAYRVLKLRTGEILSKYNISTIEWAFLGLLHDREEGLRSLMLAEALGVEAPFITVLFSKLKKQGYVHSESDPKDSRVKIILLTSKGKDFVSTTEGAVRSHMKGLVKDIPMGDLLSYISVLERIIENSKKL